MGSWERLKFDGIRVESRITSDDLGKDQCITQERSMKDTVDFPNRIEAKSTNKYRFSLLKKAFKR